MNVVGTHSWIEDLTFSLTSPKGTSVTLIGTRCDEMNDFNVSFDDQATDTPPCPYTDGNAYQPAQPLSTFNGESQMGTWTLAVQDSEDGDGGFLNNWELEICASFAPDYSLELSPDTVYGCYQDTFRFTLELGDQFSDNPVLDIQNIPLGSPFARVYNTVSKTFDVTVGPMNMPIATDTYEISLVVTDGNISETINGYLGILPEVGSMVLSTPSNGAIDVSITPKLTWQTADNATSYFLTIATDDQFTQSGIYQCAYGQFRQFDFGVERIVYLLLDGLGIG